MTAPSPAATAAVAEFRCLYTPDVRKKQKKWHDGFLAFHAFNRRVMVYDDARNLVGDTYCKDRDRLHEGDELTLDKGVLVELADPLGVTHTDLGPLLDKKPRDRPPPPTAPPRRFQPPSHVTRPTEAQHAKPVTTHANTQHVNTQHTQHVNTQHVNTQHTQHVQPRHKSLNTLLGTPRGPLGKSLPIQSPYDARQEKENNVDRAHKRQKTAHRPASLQLSSPVLPAQKPAISLDHLDAVAHLSDAPLPTTPPARPALTPAVVPSALTPRIPRGKVPVPSVKALHTPQPPTLTSSPPVSASNRLTNVDFAIQPTPVKEVVPRPLSQHPAEVPPPPPRKPKARSLRLSRGVKRGTLMICQPPPLLRPSNDARTSTADRRKGTTETDRTRTAKSRQAPEPLLRIVDDDQETIHGLLDQQLLVSVTTPPETILIDDSPEPVRPDKVKVARNPRQVTSPKPHKAQPVKPTSPPVERLTTLSTVSEPQPCTTSLSPRKLATLSTGGFRNKTKRPTPQITPAPDEPPRIEPAPPPHPLRANKKGPVMTTTELAAMLQKPKKKAKPPTDPIEDGDADPSPNRKFRRVRSENDAPIPSTSEDWEKRNLPNPTSVEAEAPAVAARKRSGLAALIKKTDPRKKFARTQSLTVETSLPPSHEVESPMASPTVDKDVGPWSTEAFDLFDWRPPRREEVGT